MPKGGARARSGPAPDPDALRRDREKDWITLPAEGREGDPPGWPLKDRTEREADLWTKLWRLPQAVMWEKNHQELEVAMHCRSFAAAELMNAPTNTRTLVRQQQEALGISLPGLHRNHWRIDGDTPAAAPTPKPPKAKKSQRRGGLKVVKGGRAA